MNDTRNASSLRLNKRTQKRKKKLSLAHCLVFQIIKDLFIDVHVEV